MFDALCAEYPELWGRIAHELRPKFVPNFEDGMAEIWTNGPLNGPDLLRATGHYFTRFRPGPRSSYLELLRALSQKHALVDTYFSSLNYDCLLEVAAREYGFERIDYFAEEATTEDSVTVWKIHGSCNFIPRGVRAGAPGVSIGSGVTIEGEMAAVSLSVARQFCERSAIPPCMAVFMEGKPVQACPSAINLLQERWAGEVEKAEAVGLIGVRPHLADEHIWGPLCETEARVVVVGDKEANQHWAEEYRRGKSTVIVGSYFADSLEHFVGALTGEQSE